MESEDRLAHAVEWCKMRKEAMDRRREVYPFLVHVEKALRFRKGRLLMFEVTTTGAMQEMRKRRN